jgi:hypothetical protein
LRPADAIGAANAAAAAVVVVDAAAAVTDIEAHCELLYGVTLWRTMNSDYKRIKIFVPLNPLHRMKLSYVKFEAFAR